MASEERHPHRLGIQIASYRIDALLGAGGMGEVYRAHDSKLGRDVAIKFLPPAVIADPDRLARFDREARILASLNHPNIAGIYGIEEAAENRALILELVEGDTLAERLQAGPIPAGEALEIASHIAAALDAAHSKGIVHRDLKPANIKITPDGAVKVLDFGLAKSVAESEGVGPSLSPTVTAGLTREGAFLGTPAYVSPEQARGKPVDRRTDIWAFGCVLYEMLTGKKPFEGETSVDTLAAILERDPDWNRLPDNTSDIVRRLLTRCLERDPQKRQRDIADARSDLADALGDRRSSRALNRRAVFSRKVLPIAVTAAVVIGVAIAGAVVMFRNRLSPVGAAAEAPVALTDFNDSAVMPALSHDGRMLTFIRGADFGRTAPTLGQVHVKLLPNGEAKQLTTGQGGGYPTFSPDDSRIVYTVVMPGLKWDSWEVPVLGGPPQLFLPNASGLTWLDDQRLVYSSIKSGLHMGIVTSSLTQAAARDIYFPENEGGMAHRTAPSPGKESLLVVEMDRGTWQPCRLVPTDGVSRGRPVGPSPGQCTSAAWSPDGKWMYFSSNSGGSYHLWRQRSAEGPPEQITFGPTEQEGTAVTPDGKYLVTSMGLKRAIIALHDAMGSRPLTDEGFAIHPTVAASGDRMFYMLRTESSTAVASGELWSVDVRSLARQRLFPGLVMTNYSLSPAGNQVLFTSAGHDGGDGIWIAELDRRSGPRQITRTGESRAFFGAAGEIIYADAEGRLTRMREDGSALEVLPGEKVLYLMTVSPDGNWASVIVPEPRGGTRVEFRSLRGEPPLAPCTGNCVLGPASVREVLPFNWSLDGRWLFVNFMHYRNGSKRTAVLPYRSGVALDKLWPKGLQSEKEVLANPGAFALDEAGTFPAGDGKAYLTWTQSFQSNLYKVRIPE